MRNVKKFLALVLAMLMVVSAAATVSAFEDVADDHVFAAAINDLTVLEIVNGYDGETFGPDDAVTRQQFALMMARAITGNVGDDAVWAQGGLVAFDDVTEYQYAIATVVKAGIVDGFLDNTFRPDEGVTFVQALKMAVAALGYDDGNLDWWQGYYNVALDLGLTKNLNQITDADKALNRGEVAQLVWNMLYAPAANGSSLAYDVFGIGVEPPVEEPATVTTLVVTATTKQYATENIDVAEGGFVGVQEIINGVPAGEVYYVAIEALGFEDDAAAEAAYLSAYNFYNWDAENATFDAAEVTGLVDVIYNADVTATSKDAAKIKIDGVNYYPVEETTGTVIKNEIVIFNADDHLYVHTEKTLPIAKDGKVYHWDDVAKDYVPVLEAVYNAADELLYFKVVEKDADGKYVSGGYVSIEKATQKYGVDVESDYDTSLEFLTVADLIEVPAYQMTVYDDDMDGKWDRAYITTVYVSAHDDTVNSTTKDYEYGPMKGTRDPDACEDGKKTNFAVTWVDVEGNEVDLAQGDVYKYTYNEQLNQITVLETYEIQYGTIDRIYTVNDKKTANYEVTVRIDGVDYVLGNEAREALGIDGFSLIDARTDVTALNNLKGRNAADTANFNSGIASIGYTYESNFNSTNFKAKNYVGFVAVDDTIILMEVIDDENNYKKALFADFVDYDLDAIYLDLWVDGEIDEYTITRVEKSNGKYADVADLSTKELMKAYQYYLEADMGDLYKLAENETGYTLSRAMDECVISDDADDHDEDDECAAVEERDDDDDLNANDFGLAWFDFGNYDMVKFDDGIGDYVANGKVTEDNIYAIRTSSSTLFYFVNTEDETISTYTGVPSDGWYITNGATIYANKLGFNDTYNDIAGTASIVVVYYDSIDQVGGFSVNGLKTKLVYMTTKYDGYDGYYGTDLDDYFNPYEEWLGSDLGLDYEYRNEVFYKYSVAAGIDVYTGAKVSTFYAHEDEILEPGAFYYMTADNVIIEKVDDEDVEEYDTLDVDFDSDVVGYASRGLYTVAGMDGASYDAVYMMKADEDNSKIKSGASDIDNYANFTGDKIVTYFVTESGNKTIFVGIVGLEEHVDGVAPDAYLKIGSDIWMGKVSFTSKTDTKIAGSVKFDAASSGSDINWNYELLFDELATINDRSKENPTTWTSFNIAVADSGNSVSYNSNSAPAGTSFDWYAEDNVLYFEIIAEPVANANRPTTTNKLLSSGKTLDHVWIDVNGGAIQFALFSTSSN